MTQTAIVSDIGYDTRDSGHATKIAKHQLEKQIELASNEQDDATRQSVCDVRVT
jgi:hypothetical protein